MKRYNRRKLQAHDAGEDRHSKGVAGERKRERLAAEHQQDASGGYGAKRVARARATPEFIATRLRRIRRELRGRTPRYADLAAQRRVQFADRIEQINRERGLEP